MRKRFTISIVVGIITLTVALFAVIAANKNATTKNELTNKNTAISNKVLDPSEIEMLCDWTYSFQEYGGPVVSNEDGIWCVHYSNNQEYHTNVVGNTVFISFTETKQCCLSSKELSDICLSVENEGGPIIRYEDAVWHIEFKPVENFQTNVANNSIYFNLSK